MLSKDEAELYDRQIRLWGVSAQSLIRQSKVLMLGFNGIASEVAKILVLAGIDTLTIVDDQSLQESDLTSNLFCRDRSNYRTHAVKEKLKVLNPLVKVNIDNSSILSKKSEDFKDYDLVTLHSFLTIDETSLINDICRQNKIKFYIVLDYGFFGFMFNDLGANFNFTYEEFQKIEKDIVKESGEKRDPISLGDEATEEDPDDMNESDDGDNSRPKKKRRLHSPKRESSPKAENEKKSTIGTLPYVTFQELISLKNTSLDRAKQINPVLLLSISMFKFYSLYRHSPKHDTVSEKQEDISRLKDIINALRISLNLNEDILKRSLEDWSENIYGSLSPICAILGGIAGQDMIRALSNKDIPIHNTFSFDGISMNGVVEKVGIADSQATHLKPIVRDSITLDFSDDEDFKS